MKIKTYLIVLISLLTFSLSSYSQEICDNGIEANGEVLKTT